MRSKVTVSTLFLAVLLGGCFGRKKVGKSHMPEKALQPKQEFVEQGGTYVFNEDTEEFRLDDSGEGAPDEGGRQVHGDDEFKWDEIIYDNDTGKVIQFDFDSAQIKPSEEKKIEENVQMAQQELKLNDKTRIAVRGHACKIAKSELYNQAISQERAENVARAYEKRGIARDKMDIVGYGASELLTNADGHEAQSVNRRVETEFVVEG